jgi:hypothetical protein
MAKAARDLQFERAAQLRDRLIDLRKAMTDSRASGEPVGAGAGPDRAPGRRGGGRWRRVR